MARKSLLSNYLKIRIAAYLLKKNINESNSVSLFTFRINFLNISDLIYMFREIFIKNIYYSNANNPCPHIIDCGANIGLATIYYKMLFPDSQIIAFEPDIKTFAILKNNIANNKLNNITLINKAVSDQDGKIKLFYNKNIPGSGRMSIQERKEVPDNQIIDSVKLSSFIKGKVDILKLDIEGAEDIVLKELSDNNKLKLINEITLEYHHHLSPREDKLSYLLKILEGNGFGYQIYCSEKMQYSNEQEPQEIIIHAYKK